MGSRTAAVSPRFPRDRYTLSDRAPDVATGILNIRQVRAASAFNHYFIAFAPGDLVVHGEDAMSAADGRLTPF
jgi:hypothetical protein